MKTNKLLLAACLAASVPASAQTLPGIPEDSAVMPKTGTQYINRKTSLITTINNGNTESLGVAIASGGNVIVGWEDDGDGLADQEAVWTMFDSAGASITPDTEMTSLFLGGSVTGKFLSYFRADGSPVFGGTSWGPKIKANLFGEGIGMGAISYGLGEEVLEFAPYDDQNSGDFPSVQLLDNTGRPIKIVAGVTAEYAAGDAQNIRIGDWDYLGNGNIVIVSESRQNDDLVSRFGGPNSFRHIVYRIVTPAGVVVKPETLVGDTAELTANQEMWHGVGVTANGFAVRFKDDNNAATVRIFDNAGIPLSTNVDLGVLTGRPEAAQGGRGDPTGFHGNGKDAYVSVNSTGNNVWLTVLTTNLTVRFSKAVVDDIPEINAVSAVDAAISENGEVIVVFAAKFDPSYANRLIMGRRFSAAGVPMGPTFLVSELELPDPNTGATGAPRVAWRNGQVVVTWVSANDVETVNEFGEVLDVVAMRMFSTFSPGSIGSVGLTRIVADTPIVKTTANALGNWEPYIGVLGTSTFLLECNTFADDELSQRYVVGLQPAAGGAMRLGEGFYTDDGLPYKGPINLSRQNGNPGRVAGDTRPGAVNFIVGGEASPHGVTGFQSDNRWSLGFDRLSDGRYGTVQIFSLNPSTLEQTMLSKALDSANSQVTTGVAQGNQISRFGGDVACLDNGNFVSVVEDRSGVRHAANTIVATIFSPNGSVVKSAFGVVTNSDIWGNVAAFKGGFAVRAKPADGTNTRVIYFYDNSGVLQGVTDQAASGVSFDPGRGDGTRLFGHINSPYVYLIGRAASTQVVKVAAFDARTRAFVAVADVNEGAFTGNFDRAQGAVDALNRLTCSWVSQPAGYAKQQVAARVLAFDGTKFTALTRSFFPFVNTATNDVRSLQMTVAMTTKQICVAAKGEINYANHPELGPDSPTEVNFYTVFTHPAPAEDPTPGVGGPAPKLAITKVGSNLSISWDSTAAGYTLKAKNSLSDATWTTVGTQNPTVIPAPATGVKFYRLEK
jgi:hypothetical protein